MARLAAAPVIPSVRARTLNDSGMRAGWSMPSARICGHASARNRSEARVVDREDRILAVLGRPRRARTRRRPRGRPGSARPARPPRWPGSAGPCTSRSRRRGRGAGANRRRASQPPWSGSGRLAGRGDRMVPTARRSGDQFATDGAPRPPTGPADRSGAVASRGAERRSALSLDPCHILSRPTSLIVGFSTSTRPRSSSRTPGPRCCSRRPAGPAGRPARPPGTRS